MKWDAMSCGRVRETHRPSQTLTDPQISREGASALCARRFSVGTNGRSAKCGCVSKNGRFIDSMDLRARGRKRGGGSRRVVRTMR